MVSFVRTGAFALVALTIVSAPARAQQPAVAPWVVAAQAGNYNFANYSATNLQEQYLRHLTGAAAADRDYFQNSVTEIERGFAALLRDTVFNAGTATSVGGLKWLSDQAILNGTFMPATEYVAAVNRFQAARIALENRIETLTGITAALPSSLRINAEGSGLQAAPNYANINWTTIRDHYTARLRDVVQLVSNLEQRVTLFQAPGARAEDRIDQIIAAGRGNSLTVPRPPVAVPAAQITAWGNQVLRLRRWNVDATDTINGFTVDYCKRQVQSFISNWSERWTSLNAGDITQRASDAEDIVHTFWARSYFRAVYGMPVGGIGVNYDRRAFNLDVLFSRTSLTFVAEPIWGETDIPRALRNYRDAVARMDERATTVGNAGNVADGRLSWVASGRNLITYLSGHRNLAIAQQMILRILAADMYEEQAIIRAGGTVLMRDRYRARYAANQADRDYYRRLADALDPRGGQVQGGVASGALSDHFARVLVHARAKLADLAQADAVQATIEAATGANRFRDLVDGRRDDILRD